MLSVDKDERSKVIESLGLRHANDILKIEETIKAEMEKESKNELKKNQLVEELQDATKVPKKPSSHFAREFWYSTKTPPYRDLQDFNHHGKKPSQEPYLGRR